jgi:hypothetical protein
MSQNKEGTEKKPGVKIQDLSPKKDAKGGVARNQNSTDLNKGGFSDQNRAGGSDQNKVNPDQNSVGGGNQN